MGTYASFSSKYTLDVLLKCFNKNFLFHQFVLTVPYINSSSNGYLLL